MGQPLAAGAGEEDEGQEAVEQDDDQDQAQGGLQDFLGAPGLVMEEGKANQQGDGRHDQGHKDGHGQRGAGAADLQPRLDQLLETINIVLEFAREEFADLGVEPVDVGDEGQ